MWVHDSVSVLDDDDGCGHSFISVTLQIDERKHAEEQTELLLGELDHRVKNVLAIVSSIVAQTLKADLSPEAFTETIAGRIIAITRAHNLLTHNGAASTGTLCDLIETELEPYRGQDLRIDGPVIALTPKAGLSLAMAIHELASNAAKYGSLSAPQGGLSVSWAVTEGPDRQLRLSWTESGGPPVPGTPSRRGFGTTLIERSLSFEFDAEVDRSFASSGVVCTIVVPFTSEFGELRTTKKGMNNGYSAHRGRPPGARR
ncbi:sensor histidine kinase [Pseudomonas sp. ERGC3:05]|nr:sensor histidine kinase [Pseudomonas sp. ERGC3:05]